MIDWFTHWCRNCNGGELRGVNYSQHLLTLFILEKSRQTVTDTSEKKFDHAEFLLQLHSFFSRTWWGRHMYHHLRPVLKSLQKFTSKTQNAFKRYFTWVVITDSNVRRIIPKINLTVHENIENGHHEITHRFCHNFWGRVDKNSPFQ